MGGQTSVFPGQNTTLVSRKLPEQSDVFVVEGIDRKINLGFGTRRPLFNAGRFAAASFGIALFSMSFTWHKLFHFPMQSVPAQGGIIFSDFQFLGLGLLIPGGDIAGGRFTFLPRFGTLDGNDFSGHNYSFSLAGFSSTSSSSSTSAAPALSTVPRAPRRRCRKAPSRSNWACASTVKRVQGMAASRVLGMVLPVSSQMP